MKSSELWKKLGDKVLSRVGERHAGEWMMIDRSDLLSVLEEAGLELEPEEPELPKRVQLGGESGGLWTHDANMEPRPLTARELSELVARYNAVQNILDHDVGHIHVDHVRRVLTSARRRLS